MRRILLTLFVGVAVAAPAALWLRDAIPTPPAANAPRSTPAPLATVRTAATESSPIAPTPGAQTVALPHDPALRAQAVALGLGAPDSDLVYTNLTPCRIVDTRQAGGRLQAGETRSFQASGASFVGQGGRDGDCRALADAPALALNVVAVQADGPGYLTAHAYGATRPYVSTLNYETGEVIGNEVLVKTTAAAQYDFSVYSLQGMHVVIDVVGYFAPPVATAPQCVTTYGDWVSVPAGTQATATAACPAAGGYALVSGGCNWDFVNLQLIQYGPIVGHLNDQGGHTCDADNTTQSEVRFRANTLCCRVPGR